ncbi:hypothetical protein MKP08_10830 [Erythrobacter sp. LQ02-29]|uniref:hypothetical protein n=1 Tax=Erythrobacter sp. LQ02-29 TaxID=2920384 RepID=UPI001F4E4EAF|nr:hypothetical protein [Erythrobacter sp. LQ02-29]MCP9223245.1 hypothetical protein [Erythrobacter sp. LQ02-29]
MEYEITDDPQGQDGEPDTPDYNDKSEVIDKHRALKNQSSTTPEHHPKGQREDQSLVQKDKKRK